MEIRSILHLNSGNILNKRASIETSYDLCKESIMNTQSVVEISEVSRLHLGYLYLFGKRSC